MRDLADDLRDYFDALADAPAPVVAMQARRRRVLLPMAVALAVAAAAVAFVVVRPRPAPAPAPAATPTVAGAVQDGLRLTLRILSAPIDGPIAVEATIENVGTSSVDLWGSAVATPCDPFAVAVQALRVAWAPAPQATYRDPRLSPFTDSSLPDDGRVYGCPAGMFGHPFAPGQQATETFTWTPPTGWPGGAHEVVATAARAIEDRQAPDPLTVRLPFEIHTATRDQIGPADALAALRATSAYQREAYQHGGLNAQVDPQWSADGWSVWVQYEDEYRAVWMVDSDRRVTRRSDVYPN